MNRIVLTIVIISICCCPLLANICDNDNGPVAVIVKDKQTTRHSQTNRTPAKLPIECYYYPFTISVELSFLSVLGSAAVSLENLTTGEVRDYAGNSALGRVVMPVEVDCAYRMDIATGNGCSYYADFLVGGEE